ncbi:hypothetical protein BC826DRAFT_966253 [Russula brevipes]|nr:hypothetical protein BC826DRAFT_966253 [Russula brevipes]
MQSGAFLQLVVTLTALVARLAHLASALRSVLSTLHAECLHLFTTIHPTETSHDLAPLQPPPPPAAAEGEDTKVSGRPLELIRRTVPDDDLDVSVDLGEVVARTPALDSQPQKSRSRSASPTLQETHDATRAPAAGARQPSERGKKLGSFHMHSYRPHATAFSSRAFAEPGCDREEEPRQTLPSSHTATEERKEKRRKRAKTRRDEIDDIFS